jgi:hypothetical protein
VKPPSIVPGCIIILDPSFNFCSPWTTPILCKPSYLLFYYTNRSSSGPLRKMMNRGFTYFCYQVLHIWPAISGAHFTVTFQNAKLLVHDCRYITNTTVPSTIVCTKTRQLSVFRVCSSASLMSMSATGVHISRRDGSTCHGCQLTQDTAHTRFLKAHHPCILSLHCIPC